MVAIFKKNLTNLFGMPVMEVGLACKLYSRSGEIDIAATFIQQVGHIRYGASGHRDMIMMGRGRINILLLFLYEIFIDITVR